MAMPRHTARWNFSDSGSRFLIKVIVNQIKNGTLFGVIVRQDV